MSESRSTASDAERQRAAEIVALLRKDYPDAKIALNFTSPLELLVATILAAQCTDERVNAVTAKLFQKYRSVQDFANADPDELEQDLKQINFYRNKAKNIREAARQIIQRFDGEVPRTIEGIASLPGAARKTANVVMGNAYGIVEGVITDTHVLRISRRLGLTKSEDPLQVERDIMALLPQKDWLDFSHLMAYHGRAICKAPKPLCAQCSLLALCPTGQQTMSASAAAPAAATTTNPRAARAKK